MIENEKIAARQFRVLVTLFTIGTSILVAPAILAAEAKQDAWIVVILGMVVGGLIIWLVSTIALFFPKMTFVQIIENLFGTLFGKCIAFIFLLLQIISSSELLYYSGTFLTLHLLPETPIVALHIMIGLIMVMAVRLGLETISRAAEIFIVVFILLFSMLLFVFPQIEFENIQPVLENGIKPLLKPTLILSSVSGMNLVTLLMIFPAYVNQPKAAQKSFFIGYIIGGFVILLVTLLSILVLGAENTGSYPYPGYILARKINVGDFLQRLEAVIAIMWVITVYFKLLLYFFAACSGLAQVLNLKDNRIITLPLGVITVAFASMIFSNVVEQKIWDQEIAPLFSLSIGVLLPLLILATSIIRKKTMRKNSKGSIVKD